MSTIPEPTGDGDGDDDPDLAGPDLGMSAANPVPEADDATEESRLTAERREAAGLAGFGLRVRHADHRGTVDAEQLLNRLAPLERREYERSLPDASRLEMWRLRQQLASSAQPRITAADGEWLGEYWSWVLHADGPRGLHTVSHAVAADPGKVAVAVQAWQRHAHLLELDADPALGHLADLLRTIAAKAASARAGDRLFTRRQTSGVSMEAVETALYLATLAGVPATVIDANYRQWQAEEALYTRTTTQSSRAGAEWDSDENYLDPGAPPAPPKPERRPPALLVPSLEARGAWWRGVMVNEDDPDQSYLSLSPVAMSDLLDAVWLMRAEVVRNVRRGHLPLDDMLLRKLSGKRPINRSEDAQPADRAWTEAVANAMEELAAMQALGATAPARQPRTGAVGMTAEQEERHTLRNQATELTLQRIVDHHHHRHRDRGPGDPGTVLHGGGADAVLLGRLGGARLRVLALIDGAARAAAQVAADDPSIFAPMAHSPKRVGTFGSGHVMTAANLDRAVIVTVPTVNPHTGAVGAVVRGDPHQLLLDQMRRTWPHRWGTDRTTSPQQRQNTHREAGAVGYAAWALLATPGAGDQTTPGRPDRALWWWWREGGTDIAEDQLVLFLTAQVAVVAGCAATAALSVAARGLYCVNENGPQGVSRQRSGLEIGRLDAAAHYLADIGAWLAAHAGAATDPAWFARPIAELHTLRNNAHASAAGGRNTAVEAALTSIAATADLLTGAAATAAAAAPTPHSERVTP